MWTLFIRANSHRDKFKIFDIYDRIYFTVYINISMVSNRHFICQERLKNILFGTIIYYMKDSIFLWFVLLDALEYLKEFIKHFA